MVVNFMVVVVVVVDVVVDLEVDVNVDAASADDTTLEIGWIDADSDADSDAGADADSDATAFGSISMESIFDVPLLDLGVS